MSAAIPAKQTMQRGTEAMKTHFSGCSKMDIRQTRRGWLQECFGCDAKNEFKYYVDSNQMAYSLEESACFARWCCQPCYSWKMQVKELNTNAELLSIERPCACPVGTCKCCC